jgi:hypothetical protein
MERYEAARNEGGSLTFAVTRTGKGWHLTARSISTGTRYFISSYGGFDALNLLRERLADMEAVRQDPPSA